jgi:hypothetical protein
VADGHALTRADTETVLRRAAQLGNESSSHGERLDAAAVADIATQVGIPPAAVATALAEQRIGVDRPLHLLDRLVGPSTVWAERRTQPNAGPAVDRLSSWLDRGHGLRPRTTSDGVVIAVRRSGLAGALGRSVRSVAGTGGLGRVREVRAAVIGVDDGSGNTVESIAMAADLTDRRLGSLLGGGMVAVVGSTATTAIAVLASPIAFAGIPVACGIGLLTSRITYRSTARRVRRDVDHTIDQIASGVDAPSVLGELAAPLKVRRLPRR